MSTNDSTDILTITQDNQRLKKNVAELKSQVEELKNELQCLKKKLKKAEYEKDNAEGHVKNLKRDLDSVRKEFYEEKQKWKQEREAFNEAGQLKDAQPCALSNETSSKDEEGQEKDIKTVLEEAASQAIAKSGLVYDENSGLYFDWSCGLYYDPNSCLYYNNMTGTYYYFNEETNSYEFHSQVELPAESTDEQYKPKKKKKKLTPKAKKKQKVIEVKTSSDENDSSSGEIISSDDDDDDDTDDDDDDNSLHHAVAPCIRAIVTNSDKLKIGTLFIVTCTGGSLGREKDVGHAIRIPDVAVSKYHCKFAYDEERRQYFICDLGSRNGTLLNDKQFGQIGKESEPQVLTHGDSLVVGGTTLSIHIHQSTDTCDECEPGIMQSKTTEATDHYQVSSQRSSENQRKKQLKNLKKAYGLQQEAYTEGSDALDKQKYRDRADLRRVKVGSDVPNQPDAPPSSVHRPISSDNKGRKMLEKMGWKDGEGLGKESAGLKEPVLATVHEQSRGIGFGVKRSIDSTSVANPSNKMLTKTKERYAEILQSNTMQARQRTTLFVPQVNKQDEDKSEVT